MPLITLPVVLISAIPVAIPFGIAAAVIATILFKILSRRPLSKGTWTLMGSTAEVATGLMMPLFSALIVFGPVDRNWAGARR
jgi:hypothetical protein